MVVFGAGKQIEAHVDLHVRSFSSLVRCVIVCRAWNGRVERLLAVMRKRYLGVAFEGLVMENPVMESPVVKSPVVEMSRVREAVGKADVICTATPSQTPLFPSSWVAPGTHLNLVGSFRAGMVEVESELVRRAGVVVVDSKAACKAEAGEVIAAGLAEEEMVEIGGLVAGEGGRVEEARRRGDVTVFKSVGVGVQDVAIAALVVSRAEEMALGTRVEY